MRRAVVAVLWLAAVLPIGASHVPFTVGHGDVIATSSRMALNDDGETYEAGTLVVFGRDGQYKGELALVSAPPLSDPLVRGGIIYMATRYPEAIHRFDLGGHLLPPFTTSVEAVNHLAPGPNGGLLATNGSCELYQFAADGSLVHFRDDQANPISCGGVELASDGCGVFWTVASSVVGWNACTYPAVQFVSLALPVTFDSLRLLSDGSYLVSMANHAPALRLDRQANIIRDYGIIGKGLALDIDGMSFWTNEFGWIMRVDLATGAVLSRTFHGRTWGLAVVGEPRAGLLGANAAAEVPMVAPSVLAIMAAVLAFLALYRIR